MTYRASRAANERYRRRQWALDWAEVKAFAHDLHRVGVISDSSGLLEYFDKPQGWSREHEWWETHGRSDDPDVWDQAGML